MKKTIYLLVMAVLCLNFKSTAQQFAELSGQVASASGKPLPGATVKIKSGAIITTTDKNGNFSINTGATTGTLIISFLGYQTKEATFNTKKAKFINVILQESENTLTEVSIVSTGYQNIPKERVTGSFVLIDSALLQRKVSTNILDRLDGVTSGLIFNRGITDGSNKSDISIRGRSTIFANPNPLIVLDNFPFDGDINTINPNDIASITILKDAAAASIWGVRAGNGVIVITTKKGRKGSDPVLDFSSNLTIGSKPDLWYTGQMSSSEYIDLEQFLFDKGYYRSKLRNAYTAISPAVELMAKLQNKQISADDFQQQIAELKQLDARKDLNNHLYRRSLSQQYNLNISGGSAHQKYFLSGGYDHNLANQKASSYNRFTLKANNTFNLINDKLELFTSISLAKSKTTANTNTSNFKSFTPYDRLADPRGNPLPVVGINTLRASYTDSVGQGKLLDWRYFPLQELKPNRNLDALNYRLLTSLTYRLTDQFKFQLNYQYEKGTGENVLTNSKESFYTRDLINKFSSINSATNEISRILPIGDIVDIGTNNSTTQYARAQFSYENTFKGGHELNALAGFEIKDHNDEFSNQIYYGFDPATKSNANATINPLENYPIYYNPFGSSNIPTAPGQLGNIDRSRSYYANAAYTYKDKYTLSASARKDETNIFGVKSNQKGVPLWSAGFGWDISKEGFYHFADLPYLKFRATYGYNGNADKNTSAYLTANAAGVNLWNILYAEVINPPNPSLGWEKIQNINFGLDFSTKNNWFSGSIEYYIKRGKNLIGNSPISPQTGVTLFKGNTADTKTHGFDLTANFNLLNRRNLKWIINTLYSYNKDQITSYKLNQSVNGDLVFGNYSNPLVGYPYYAMFAFKSAGLDASGNPRGYLNGQISNDYSAIYNSFDRDDLQFLGNGTPRSFGSIRNTLNLQNFSISVNLVYKLGYYFRRANVFNGSTYNYNQSDYDLRWQNPGDEQHTAVPSLNYPASGFRGIFYQGTPQLIEKGDHVRLQDVRLSCQLSPKTLRHLPIKRFQFYVYLNNLGILWKANKKGLDPDAGTSLFPAVRTYSIGLNANF